MTVPFPWKRRTRTEAPAPLRRRLKLCYTVAVVLAPGIAGVGAAAVGQRSDGVVARPAAVAPVAAVQVADQNVATAKSPIDPVRQGGNPGGAQLPAQIEGYNVNVSAAAALLDAPPEAPPGIAPTEPQAAAPRSLSGMPIQVRRGVTATQAPAQLVQNDRPPASAALAPPPNSAKPDPDVGSVTVKLIELLVNNGTLSRDQANALLQEARQEARQARGAPARAAVAVAPGVPGRAGGVARAAPPTVAAANAPSPAAPPEVPSGTVRVTYVPPTVRAQIAAEVKQQVMAEAQQEGWAAPNQLPDWVHRFHISGDLRLRNERDFQNRDNFPFFPDFNAINNSSNGFDTNGGNLPPLLNATENRNRFRLRARLNVEAEVNDWVTADIRIATGNDNIPISTDQTLGQPGDFSKFAIWLDRAYIKFQPTEWLNLWTGRMPNPFWTTSLLFYEELGFDGIGLQARYPYSDWLAGFLNAGAFPVFNTAFNFGSTSVEKSASRNAYLLALQAGTDWKIDDNYLAKFGAAYFNFSNVQGKLSTPCFNPTGFGGCNTDDTKPAFLQFGNTLFPIRNIVPDPANPNGPNPEFFGLASQFNILDLHAQFRLLNLRPIEVVLDADFAKNLGFKRSSVLSHGPVNNLGANNVYQGGGNGYMVGLTVGHPVMEKRWDWNAWLAYKYVESDAVLDAITDPYFHLGGTNAKGYIVGGNLGLDRNLWMSARWYSAVQVSGPPFSSDTLLVDLNAKF